MAKSRRNQRPPRPQGYIAEDRGLHKGHGHDGEGHTGDHGLDRRALGLQGREKEEIKTWGVEIQGLSLENWQGGGFNWNPAESDYISGARDMDFVTGKFGDVGKMARLSG